MSIHADRQHEKNRSGTASDKSVHNAAGQRFAHRLQDNRPKSIGENKQIGGSGAGTSTASLIQKKENNTGLPDQLKNGIENLSGIAMDDVKVHYHSSQPAQLNAHAYAQGTDIHISTGQEKYLPHEAWHVVQQKQGRVKPTLQMKEKTYVNDDKGLEQEADRMGAKAMTLSNGTLPQGFLQKKNHGEIAQLVTDFEKPGEEHSKTQAGIFGIGPAGWVFLGDAHRGKKIFGWDNKPIADKDNIYSLENFFEHGWKTITVDKKMLLIEGWVKMVTGPLEPDAKVRINGELTSGVKVSEILEREMGGGEVNFRGFYEWAQNEPEANAAMKQSAGKVKSIKDQEQKQAYFHSKQGLVALLQKNVELYYAGLPLIPTFIVIRKQGKDDSSHFVPDLKSTRDKSTIFTTDKEIRMIYKLTQEAPDAKLRSIAQKTFFFQHQDATDEANRTFKNIPAPWEHMDKDYTSRSTAATDNFSHDAVAKWEKRNREGGKKAYKDRAAHEVPHWMQELVKHREKHEREQSVMNLDDKSGIGGRYEVSKGHDGITIKYSFLPQLGGRKKEKIIVLSFKDLAAVEIEYEKGDDDTEMHVIIKRPGADFNMVLSAEQAARFKLMVTRMISEHTKLGVEDISSGGLHKLAFDVKTLKLERTTANMGINRTNSYEVLLADIVSVEFTADDNNIEIEISGRSTQYTMAVSRAKAESVRKLLLLSSLDSKKVGEIPLPKPVK